MRGIKENQAAYVLWVDHCIMASIEATQRMTYQHTRTWNIRDLQQFMQLLYDTSRRSRQITGCAKANSETIIQKDGILLGQELLDAIIVQSHSSCACKNNGCSLSFALLGCPNLATTQIIKAPEFFQIG